MTAGKGRVATTIIDLAVEWRTHCWGSNDTTKHRMTVSFTEAFYQKPKTILFTPCRIYIHGKSTALAKTMYYWACIVKWSLWRQVAFFRAPLLRTYIHSYFSYIHLCIFTFVCNPSWKKIQKKIDPVLAEKLLNKLSRKTYFFLDAGRKDIYWKGGKGCWYGSNVKGSHMNFIHVWVLERLWHNSTIGIPYYTIPAWREEEKKSLTEWQLFHFQILDHNATWNTYWKIYCLMPAGISLHILRSPLLLLSCPFLQFKRQRLK